MTTNIRGVVVFVATGLADSGVNVQNGIVKSGDVVLDVWDITSPGPIQQNFGDVLTGHAGIVAIVELSANSAIAGHTMIATIGIGPSG